MMGQIFTKFGEGLPWYKKHSIRFTKNGTSASLSDLCYDV